MQRKEKKVHEVWQLAQTQAKPRVWKLQHSQDIKTFYNKLQSRKLQAKL